MIISALKLLDKFYLEGYSDPYYAARRENTLFISIVCNNPDPTCFCIGLGTGPYLEGGFDIQMTDLGDRYFVQTGSSRGAKTVRAFSFLFSRPKKADYEDQYEAFLSSKARFQKRISLEAVDKGNDSWNGNVGLVTGLWPEVLADFKKAVAYICGPDVMIKAAMRDLFFLGMPDEMIITTLESHMKCGIGKCGHCYYGAGYICTDGPVFSYRDIKEMREP